jgi:hypothetical protein
VQSSEGVGRAEPASALEDGAGDRQDVIRMGREERLEVREPLGDPGPLVKEVAGGEEGLEIDGHDHRAGPDHVVDIAPQGGPDAGVDPEAGDVRDREPRRSGQYPPRGSGAGPGIVRVRACEDVEDVVRVVDRVREHVDAVQGAAGRDDTVGAHEAARRFEPDDPVHRGRDAARTCGVGAEGEGDAARGHGDRAPRTGPARDEVAPVDALAGAVRGADAGEPGRELVEVGLADEDRAGVEQPADGGGVARRPVGEGGTAGGRREPGGVDVVLHRERDPEERECGGVQLFEGARPLAEFAGWDPADPHGVVAALGDALEDEVDDLHRPRPALQEVRAQGTHAEDVRRARQVHAVDCRQMDVRREPPVLRLG